MEGGAPQLAFQNVKEVILTRYLCITYYKPCRSPTDSCDIDLMIQIYLCPNYLLVDTLLHSDCEWYCQFYLPAMWPQACEKSN